MYAKLSHYLNNVYGRSSIEKKSLLPRLEPVNVANMVVKANIPF
jgi:hypothetical protein